jgi:hypothetical protein
MAKPNSKEGMSISVRSATVEALHLFLKIKDIDTASFFIDQAIREKIARDMTSEARDWKQFIGLLRTMSS